MKLTKTKRKIEEKRRAAIKLRNEKLLRKHLGELKEVERPIAADQNQIEEDWLVNMHTDSRELDRGHGTNPGPNVQGIRPKVDLKRKSHCTQTDDIQIFKKARLERKDQAPTTIMQQTLEEKREEATNLRKRKRSDGQDGIEQVGRSTHRGIS